MDAAFAEARTFSSRSSAPESTASAASRRVMTFVTEAGGLRSVSPLA